MPETVMFAKSKRFASRIVRMYRFLVEQKKEFVLSKQVLRSGTSIGANLAEGEYASSPADFLNKQRIALKECAETIYWIDLLHENGFLPDHDSASIRGECDQLLRMLIASVKTLSSRVAEEPPAQYDCACDSPPIPSHQPFDF